jgi:hypothetical protein
LFIIVTLIAVTNRNKSTQNQVWAGMAKRPHNQLGTPLSSLQGWVELLKETEGTENIATERARMWTGSTGEDRFGKIGAHLNW